MLPLKAHVMPHHVKKCLPPPAFSRSCHAACPSHVISRCLFPLLFSSHSFSRLPSAARSFLQAAPSIFTRYSSPPLSSAFSSPFHHQPRRAFPSFPSLLRAFSSGHAAAARQAPSCLLSPRLVTRSESVHRGGGGPSLPRFHV